MFYADLSYDVDCETANFNVSFWDGAVLVWLAVQLILGDMPLDGL